MPIPSIPAPSPNTIDFDIPASDPGYTEIASGLFDAGFTYWTIAPTSALPALGPDVTINGLVQPGVGPPTDPYDLPEIVLSGAQAGEGSTGLDLYGGGDSLLDVTINGFSGDGIDVDSSNNTIQYGLVGTDPTGTTSVGNGVGILVTGAHNLIGTDGNGGAVLDNVEGVDIAGNLGPGVWISGSGATGNVIAGDYIGLNFVDLPLANGGDGLLIDNGASDNWIGVNSVDSPETVNDGNFIESNVAAGVEIKGFDTTGNVVAGNTIESNGTDGVLIDNKASGNWVGANPVDGSETTLQDNVISGNTGDGVEISGMDTTGNVVAGDYIGTDPSGMHQLPNYAGIEIDGGASGNLIGSNGDAAVDDALERNIISGNLFTGVWITGIDTEKNVVAGNFIGTTVSGNTALGNGSTYVGLGDDDINGGVLIDGGASDNLIGTSGHDADDAGERNVISGNVSSGIILSGTSGNVVAGNYLGTTASGDGALGNGTYGDGVDLVNGSSGNWIGVNSAAGPGTENADQGNLISGTNPNDGWGVWIDPTSSDNIVAGNLIGTDATGKNSLRNSSGIWINGPSNLVGTTGQDGADDAIERNVISGNTQFGVVITGTSATGNVIAGNYIGTTANGDASLANQGDGVVISAGADNNWIGVNPVSGGPGNADQRDFISGNQDEGISIQGSTGNVVAGDYIGTNAAGDAALGNGIDGVDIRAGASNNWIGVNSVSGGPENTDQRNIISGNGQQGIAIQGVDGNVVAGDYIGTNACGTAALGNSNGVDVYGGSSNNWIGVNPVLGPENADQGNLLSGNDASGVDLNGGTGNVVAGNFIGTTASGTGALADGYCGVLVTGGASNDWIGVNPVAGGPENAVQGNVISATGYGVYIDGACSDNTIAGNFLGTDASGQNPLGNIQYDIAITGASASAYAVDNTLGLPGAGNVIAGGAYSGVRLDHASGTVIQGNKVGTTADGMSVISSFYYNGIEVVDSPDTLIGGTTPGTGNLISLGTYSSSGSPINGSVGGFPWGNAGIEILEESSSSFGSAGTLIEGNLIGTNLTGAKVLGNPTFGINLVNSSGITIGGTASGAGNVIAGSSEGGISILSGSVSAGLPDVGSSDNLIEGNLIGINFDSHGEPIAGLGNGGTFIPNGYAANEAGIYINDPADPKQTSTGNTIGGLGAGAGNIIANNVGPGVAVVGANAFDNPILGNPIYGNSGLGIDLGDDGVTPHHTSPTTGASPMNRTATRTRRCSRPRSSCPTRRTRTAR